MAMIHASTVQLYRCLSNNVKQTWVFNLTSRQLVQKDGSGCLRALEPSTNSPSKLDKVTCKPGDDSMSWIFTDGDNMGKIKNVKYNRCIDDDYGKQVWMAACHKNITSTDNQAWYLNKSSGNLISGQSLGEMCLDTGNIATFGEPCGPNSKFKTAVFCDTKQPLTTRINDYIKRISLKDKLGQFSNNAKWMDSVGVGPYSWWNENLHGVIIKCLPNGVCATSFPQVITTASSFNRSLFHAIGSAVGTEARAFNNLNQTGRHGPVTGLTFWAPNVNIYRDPRWGRGHETPGEDPILNADYAELFVNGMQIGLEDPKRLKVSACCKHYAAYSVENWHGMDRHHFDARVSEQDLVDTYYVPFQACVQKGKASGVMCSYNSVNGIPACANQHLLTEMLRSKWKFDGYITSDCSAVKDVFEKHNYTKTPGATVRAVLRAGMDSNCGSFLQKNIQSALDMSYVTETDINKALFNMYSVQFRLGMFDPWLTQPYKNFGINNIDTNTHRQLALDAARQGIVLLKNLQNNLPLNKIKHSHIAVIGPNANATTTMQADYHGKAPFLISVLMGLSQLAGITTSYAKGCDIYHNDTSGIASASALAAVADATIIVVGNSAESSNPVRESEGKDRESIKFPGVQEDLITQAAAASKGPVIVVIMSGGAQDLRTIKTNDQVAGILWVGYPGQSGGQAIAEILYGKINPSGRLTQTFYADGFYSDFLDMNMRPNKTSGNPGRTHRFYTGTPVYPFGAGLSYTKFSYSLITTNIVSISSKLAHTHLNQYYHSSHKAPTLFTVEIMVKNIGSLSGTEVVLLFGHPPRTASTIDRPRQVLLAYQRVPLMPNQQSLVRFHLSIHHIRLANQTGKWYIAKGEWKLIFRNNHLKSTTFFLRID